MQAVCKNDSRGAAFSPGTPGGPGGPAGPAGPGGPGRAIVDKPSETQTHTLAYIHIYRHIQCVTNPSLRSHTSRAYAFPQHSKPQYRSDTQSR